MIDIPQPAWRGLCACPDVGRWLLAWLAGECGRCNGRASVETPSGARRLCHGCRGYTPWVRQHLTAIEDRLASASGLAA